EIAVVVSKMAMVTFGGAYAVLAYVAQRAVEGYGWLKPGEMLDGLGMAETTPGPLIMVLQFVGFMAAFRDPGSLSPMLAGTLWGLFATCVTFTPCFLWIFLGAPFIEVLRDNKAVNGALSAITAAVVGVVLNLAIWFAIHTVFREVDPVRAFPLAFDAPRLTSVDPWALALAVAAAVAIFRFKVGMIPTLVGCCGAGLVLYVLGVHAWAGRPPSLPWLPCSCAWPLLLPRPSAPPPPSTSRRPALDVLPSTSSSHEPERAPWDGG